MITLRTRPRALLVDEGRVMCPLRGDTDVENCFGCRWARSLQLDVQPPRVTCDARVQLGLDELFPVGPGTPLLRP